MSRPSERLVFLLVLPPFVFHTLFFVPSVRNFLFLEVEFPPFFSLLLGD